MKNLILSAMIAFIAFTGVSCNNAKAKNNVGETDIVRMENAEAANEISVIHSRNKADAAEAKIQIAILLDTSSSMDGLIEQAKSRLWNIVNTMTTLKFKGKTPEIEIALYEYGNDRLQAKDNYIRQVTPLTTDLDLISEKLFSLTTWGGSEYCGAVIHQAVRELKWGDRPSDMKLVYIAGNEPFTQGPINYIDAISGALGKSIYVNTIHCGDGGYGGLESWQDGAYRGKGKFFNINHDAKVRHYATPYDDKISEYNVKLNDTYVSYGSMGRAKKQNQAQQDINARSISSANYAERVVTKTKSNYKNTTWDLVDMVKEDKKVLDKLEKSDLPKELQNKSKEDIQKYVESKDQERSQLQSEIAELAKKRQEYIDEQIKKEGDNAGDDLGKAINQSALDIAMALGYVVVEE